MKMSSEGVARYLEDLASELRQGNLYPTNNVWEDQDFETGKLEITVRSNDADMTKKGQFLQNFKQRYGLL